MQTYFEGYRNGKRLGFVIMCNSQKEYRRRVPMTIVPMTIVPMTIIVDINNTITVYVTI